MQRKAFILGAVALVLLFIGIIAYPLLWPVLYWNVTCVNSADGFVQT